MRNRCFVLFPTAWLIAFIRANSIDCLLQLNSLYFFIFYFLFSMFFGRRTLDQNMFFRRRTGHLKKKIDSKCWREFKCKELNTLFLENLDFSFKRSSRTRSQVINSWRAYRMFSIIITHDCSKKKEGVFLYISQLVFTLFL